MSIDKLLWVSIENGTFISKSIVDGISVKKAPKKWNGEKTKKVSYDLKMGNLLIFVLNANVYFSISHCRIDKTMWDSLQVLHEGAVMLKNLKLTF